MKPRKIIGLFLGGVLLIAIVAFQGSSPGKGCFNCEKTAVVTFTNNTANKVALVVTGPVKASGTIEVKGAYAVYCTEGKYSWIAFYDYVQQGNEFTGETAATGTFSVVGDGGIAIQIN